MTFGRSSRGFRPSRSRGPFRGSTYRGRGRGSDSYYGSSRGSYSSSRGSYRGSSFRGREESYDSRGSSSRYSSDRYSSSHSRRDEGSYHHREVRESASGSFGRDHSRRSDGEPERKRIRSEIGSSYKEGMSPRRSYDDLEHSSRSFNTSNSSPYRSDSSPFAKTHRSKEFSDFKKPLPPDTSFSGRPSRGSRGRGVTRSATGRIIKSSVPSFLRRTGVGQISRLKTTSRLQQVLRRKKQIRLLRMRKARETHGHLSSTKDEPSLENNIDSSEEELDLDGEEDELDLDVSMKDESLNESQSELEDIKKTKTSDILKKSSPVQESSRLTNEEVSPMRGFHRDHITLKCVHCKIECPTFKRYAFHLSSYKHKLSMEKLLFNLKQKLRQMRTEQREQQRIIDEQSNDFAKTSYCRLCKLNYKQTKQEHFTSDFHINLNEFLNPRCSVCRISFATPILYEHHRCTLNHIKRKAFLEKKGVDVKDADNDDENNDDDNFMVLDSVGSADESSDEAPPQNTVSDEDNKVKKTAIAKKKKLPKVVGAEFIKRVPVYYCKLCRLCLTYNPNRNQEDSLLVHCRGRFHLKRYSLEKVRRAKEEQIAQRKRKLNKEQSSEEAAQNGTLEGNDSIELEADESVWDDAKGDPKSSEDDEDTHESNRYDRFGHSEENDNADMPKTVDASVIDDDDGNQNDTKSQT